MSQLKIEYVPIEKLKTYPNNAKIHTAEQIEQIKQSIQQFGFNDPIAVWKKNEIIEGHGRLIAANELGLKEVPIIRLDNLTDDERRAYMLVHNQLTMNTGFDVELLDIELEMLDIDVSAYGLEPTEIQWDLVEEITKENYEKPDTERLRCPLCGGEDEKIRFVKVK